MLARLMEFASAMPGPLEHTARTVAIFIAGSWIALLFHELGHAFAALALGVRIWGIRLGAGPIVWRGAISECRMHLALSCEKLAFWKKRPVWPVSHERGHSRPR